MGHWLKQRLHTESKVAVDQTYRYKLPVTGFYSCFEIRAAVKRSADRDDTAKVPLLHERIPKIEMLMEGTKVLKSFRGRECLALNLFDFGRPNECQNSEQSGGYCVETFYLLGGRSLHDKKWMFDMSKLRDPEIAITNNVDNLDGVDMDEDTLEYQIFGWRWLGEPMPTPVGFMRADERLHYDTTGANVEKVVPISLGKRIRRILIMGWEERHTFYDHWKNVELQVDEGAYSPVIIPNITEWMWQNKLEYKLDIRTIREFFLPTADASYYCDVCMCYPQYVGAIQYGNIADSGQRIFGFNDGIPIVQSDADGQPHTVWADGAGYMTALLIGFDIEPDLSDMLDTKPMACLKLLGTETADADTVSMVVEEELLY